MAEEIRVLLVLGTEKKSSQVLRALEGGGFAPQSARVRSLRSLKSALLRGSWDLLVADSRLWQLLALQEPRLLDSPAGPPVLLLTAGAEAELEAGNSVRWDRLEALAPVVRALLRERARPESLPPAAGLLERLRRFLKSYLAVLVTALVGLLATGGIFAYYQTTERRRLQTDFQTIAAGSAQAIRLELARHETVLSLLGSFYEATAESAGLAGFSREFRQFARGILNADPALLALAIVPRLTEPERPSFSTLTGFRLTQIGPDGKIRPAGRREEYFPLLAMQPRPRAASILGLDLATAPGLRETLEKARATGRLATSARNLLPDPQAEAYAVWQFLPLYEEDEAREAPAGSRKLTAYAALVFRVDRLVELALSEAAPSGIDLELLDTSAPEAQRFSYYHRSRPLKAGARYEELTGNLLATAIDAGGRTWTLFAYATYGFVARHRTWQSWFILFGGLALTAFAGIYIALRVREAGRSERLVEQRTLALSREIEKQKRLQQELESSRLTLTSRVAELDNRNREIQLLNELGDVFQACLSTEEAYPVVALYAPKLLPDTSGALYIQEAGADLLNAAAQWGPTPPATAVFKPEDCWGLRLGRVHAASSAAGRLPCRHAPERADGGSLCVPLSAMGETLGLFHVTGLPEAAQAFAVSVAEHIGLALSNLKLRSELRQLSIHDPLTNLYNRRYMEEALELELRRAERKKLPVGIIMLDIDHFKEFNDGFGHAAGDELLRFLGTLLRERLRAADVACRYGGEEFMLILPEAALEATRKRAEDLRLRVKELEVAHEGKPLGPVTVSLGVAVYPAHGRSGAQVIQAADAALYRAKAEGRDRVVVAEGPAS